MASRSISTDKSRTYSTSNSFSLTVLISGSGTNLQALIDACGQAPPSKDKPAPRRLLPNAEISHVICNRREAKGIARAQDAHIPVTYHNLLAYKKKFPDTEAGVTAARNQYDTDLAQKILTHIPCPDLVVCAGFMHILSPVFINALASANVPIINLHPALPGQFDGANAIGRAYEAFQRGEISNTGVMVHYVTAEVDRGAPVLVREVEIKPGESQSDLEERIHETEWKLIVDATSRVLADLEEKRRQES
ncbi:phosphoribosylglycinamide formyltransferase [Fonsecaea monophora]|uniref:Phosphoribosylglycinamide formyltransferase n=2 Tax=Fonsecaea TaxID=40354 RepID=A0A178CFL1_9EURO|nr:phosphoribosylglycinamide formyltransferase [Fonsecaea nubica]XP_022515044.1 phosphoribosylglycinamide formyltransferase [Fonsecaea monophora]KAH0836070.1 Phosphoribosylglycinamide formyltransferase [Fonsecaea pedrosoi]OAG43092.1 phosphoribosylglycinamide formyltransferase [Fonsecaea monophora]OAL28134.1 phosphoribosylglycinamide formyltransferase [Fonsecaea nubica]